MEVGLGEAVEVVGKAGWGLNHPDNFFVSSTDDKINSVVLYLYSCDGINVVAVNLRP